jgi:Ca-activated chloride channel family protein
MKLDADNPMLTAYALGELDEPQRAEIEAQLEQDEAARKLVDEIRASAVLVSQELKSERTTGLDDAAHAKIFARHSAPAAKKFVYWKPMLAAAALLFVVCTVALTTVQHRESAKSVAITAPNQSFVQSTPAAVKATGRLTPKLPEEPTVPSDVLEKGKLGDHFETINPDQKKPQSESELQDSIGVGGAGTIGTGGGANAGTGTFGNPKKKGMTLGYAMSEAPAAYDKTERDEFMVKHSGTIYQGEKKSALDNPQGPAKTPATEEKIEFERRMKEEVERLKNDPEYAKAIEHFQPASKVDKIVDSRYGPNAAGGDNGKVVTTGGFYVENGYRIEKNGFKKSPSDVPERTEPGYIAPLNPQPAPAPGESYPALVETGFKRVTDEPLSTFSIDVDTASYANVRRFLGQGQLPPRDAVRIEEMLNYFSYNYGQPQGDDPFAIHVEVAQCPWNTAHRLARVGIKGREFAENKRPAGNYVFLIDVSGSMDEPKKRPLVQAGLNMLVDKLGENDRVGIVTYAGEAAVSLPSTACSEKQRIKDVINGLRAAGSTNGGDGIQRAYRMATENFMKGGINRVILCTDGDFNVGVTNQNDLVNLIEAQAKSGVFLSVLGFGMGNLKDATMQKLADKGNGNYAYIDSLDEVRKVLVDQMMATLATIAKDVKIQVEFNPAKAGAYRLIGYEKRLLNKQDFNNDKVDAGEVGAGHQVTALYEIVPAGALESEPGVDALIYQKNPETKPAAGANNDLLTLKIRYKPHDGDTSKLIKGAVADSGGSYSQASKDFKFAAAVAAFGMLLRESPYRGNTSLDAVLELADEARGKDEGGYRREFLSLVEKAKALMKR